MKIMAKEMVQVRIVNDRIGMTLYPFIRHRCSMFFIQLEVFSTLALRS